MKEKVTNFDFEAAFKALDEIEVPKVKGIRANRLDLQESTKRVDRLGMLIEDYYDINDPKDIETVDTERQNEIAAAKLARIEKIVDLDADSEDDLLPSYVGKVIIQCPQCMTLFYKNPEDIEREDENSNVVNVNEICQHCGNDSGYEIIGKVAEETEELPVEEEPTEEENAEELESEETPVEENEESEENAEELELPDELEVVETEETNESVNRSKLLKDAEKNNELATKNHSKNLTLHEDYAYDTESAKQLSKKVNDVVFEGSKVLYDVLREVEDAYKANKISKQDYIYLGEELVDVANSAIDDVDFVGPYAQEFVDQMIEQGYKDYYDIPENDVDNYANNVFEKELGYTGLELTIYKAVFNAISENYFEEADLEESVNRSKLLKDAEKNNELATKNHSKNLTLHEEENEAKKLLSDFLAEWEDNQLEECDKKVKQEGLLDTVTSAITSPVKNLGNLIPTNIGEDVEDKKLTEAQDDDVSDAEFAAMLKNPLFYESKKEKNVKIYNSLAEAVEDSHKNIQLTGAKLNSLLDQMVNDPFFAGLTKTSCNRLYKIYKKDVIEDNNHVTTVKDIKDYLEDGLLGAFILDNADNLNYQTIAKLGEKDPVFVKTLEDYYGYEDVYDLSGHVLPEETFIEKINTIFDKKIGMKAYYEMLDELKDMYKERLAAGQKANEGLITGALGAAGAALAGGIASNVINNAIGEECEGAACKKEDKTEALIKNSPVTVNLDAHELGGTGNDVSVLSPDKVLGVGDKDVKEDLAEENNEKAKDDIDNFMNSLDNVADKDSKEAKEDKEATEEKVKVDDFDKLDEIYDEELNSHITNYLTEVYSNVKNFEATSCALDNNTLILEGKINFTSGKSKNTTFNFVNEDARLKGTNKALAEDAVFYLDYSIKNNGLLVENFTYKYTIDKNIIEGCTRK